MLRERERGYTRAMLLLEHDAKALLGRLQGLARTEAARAHNEHTAEYLMGTPLLADYLSEGLACLGISCADFELQHQ